MLMNKFRGFTIVELLIVIVVIAILATISVVTYSGIQTRAKNAQTVNAAAAWAKILKLYHAETGFWPTVYSCLGTTSTYQGNNGQCWDSTAWTVKSGFLSQVQPYTSNYPEPDTTDTTAGTANPSRRGLLYSTDNSTYWIMYVFQIGSGTCPSVGLPLRAGPNNLGGGYHCIYNLV